MTIKSVIFKVLEYTPLGLIPGVLRISCALNPKVQKVAQNYLNVNRQSASYSKPKEIIRGIISCIPIVNLILIPIDLVGRCSSKKATIKVAKVPKANKSSTAREKNLKKAEKALLTLASFYQEIEELKANKKLNDSYLSDKYGLGKRQEILKTLKDLGDSAEKLFGPVLRLYELPTADKDNFDITTFTSCLQEWNDHTNLQRQLRHAYYILECSADTNLKIADYLRTHHQAALEYVQNELKSVI